MSLGVLCSLPLVALGLPPEAKQMHAGPTWQPYTPAEMLRLSLCDLEMKPARCCPSTAALCAEDCEII